MAEAIFPTTKEVFDHCRGTISIGTLENWMSLRIGSSFVKLGKTISYSVKNLDRWDQEIFVTCPAHGRSCYRKEQS